MKQGTVLVVDDEFRVLDVLHDILETEGYTVVTADNATAALEEVERKDFDVAIVDILLPQACGLTLVRRLRRKNPHIAVIAMSGYNSLELERLVDYHEVQDYLVKPIDKSRLCMAVSIALKTKKLAKGKLNNKRLQGNLTI